jgi:hypothetical protein
VARNRVFSRIFGDSRESRKKPGFFGARVPETGFLRDPSLQPADSGKNPVSLDFYCALVPETGFLRDPSSQPADSGKNPVSLDFNRRFPPNA